MSCEILSYTHLKTRGVMTSSVPRDQTSILLHFAMYSYAIMNTFSPKKTPGSKLQSPSYEMAPAKEHKNAQKAGQKSPKISTHFYLELSSSLPNPEALMGVCVLSPPQISMNLNENWHDSALVCLKPPEEVSKKSIGG